MRHTYLPLLLALGACRATDADTPAPTEEPIHSHLVRTEVDDLILVQEVVVEAPVAEVWAAYTTEDGWRAWASPAVAIDLRAGGTIRTHYGPDARVGDPGTNTLHIVNYVPERVLTLRADVEERWPDVMKEDADNLMNVIVFESPTPNRTRILSYGVGYRDTEAYAELMAFFVPANEGLFQGLKDTLEQ